MFLKLNNNIFKYEKNKIYLKSSKWGFPIFKFVLYIPHIKISIF
jgi:hypothetical protein